MNRAQPPTTRRETIHGGSTPASMRVMVVDRCPRFISLTVNGTAVSAAEYKFRKNIATTQYMKLKKVSQHHLTRAIKVPPGRMNEIVRDDFRYILHPWR